MAAKNSIKKHQDLSGLPSTDLIAAGTKVATTVIVVGALGVGAYYANRAWKERKKGDAEKELASPSGQIAAELKSLFATPFLTYNDALLYRQISTRITPENKADVFRIYKDLTGNNLSDELSRLPAAEVEKAQKVEQYNAKPGKLFSVLPNNTIRFEVARGGSVKFDPANPVPVEMFADPMGIVLRDIRNNPKVFGFDKNIEKELAKDVKTVQKTVSVVVSPNSRSYPVAQVKTIPWDSIQWNSSVLQMWFGRIAVKAHKEFAAIQIIGGKDATGRTITAWIDARDMVNGNYKYSPAKPAVVKGLGRIHLVA